MNKVLEPNTLDVIIIGAGPAGLTAALYAGRFRLKSLVFEMLVPGGQILLSPTIENYPGFPKGIATDELISLFKKQVEELDVPFVNEHVVELRDAHPGGLHGIELVTRERTYLAKSVIVASGANSKRLGVRGEDAFLGKGVSYCGTCDGPLFKNKEVVVVGGGDRAIEDALFLSTYCRKVTVVHRRQELRASQILVEKARANAKISFLLDSVIENISGGACVESVTVANLKAGTRQEYPTQGVFIFVGIIPRTEFINKYLQTDESGFIITDQAMQSSKPGVFACGDCRVKSFYQVISACGEGAHAADSAHKYLLTCT